MIELEFTQNKLKDIIKNKYVGSGSEASVYKYTDDLALRIYDIEENIYIIPENLISGDTLCKEMIENLIIYGKNIKNIDFPIGIVKINDIVVGQIIKYYDNSITLEDFLTKNKDIDPRPYYLEVLNILEELVENNICYKDVHGRNFMLANNQLKIIDFTPFRIKINEVYKGMYYDMFQNFIGMVNKINKLRDEENFKIWRLPEEIKLETNNPKKSFEFAKQEIQKLDVNITKNKTL